jgi:hypothetical protein
MTTSNYQPSKKTLLFSRFESPSPFAAAARPRCMPPHNAARRRTTPHNAAQRRKTPHKAAQRRTTPHNAARRRTPPHAARRRTPPSLVSLADRQIAHATTVKVKSESNFCNTFSY